MTERWGYIVALPLIDYYNEEIWWRVFPPDEDDEEMNAYQILIERAEKRWTYQGVECLLVKNKHEGEEKIRPMLEAGKFSKENFDFLFTPYYCGYVILPQDEPLPAEILSSIDVHGGVTFDRVSGEVLVYGFDCNHADDYQRAELRDVEWLTCEVEHLANQLLEAIR